MCMFAPCLNSVQEIETTVFTEFSRHLFFLIIVILFCKKSDGIFSFLFAAPSKVLFPFNSARAHDRLRIAFNQSTVDTSLCFDVYILRRFDPLLGNYLNYLQICT